MISIPVLDSLRGITVRLVNKKSPFYPDTGRKARGVSEIPTLSPQSAKRRLQGELTGAYL